MKGLYEIRNYWALTYLREYFFGGMTTTGRSESTNAFVKRFINSHTSLADFAKQVWHIFNYISTYYLWIFVLENLNSFHVDIAIDDIRQKE